MLHGYPRYPNTLNCTPEEADEFLEPQMLELNLNSAQRDWSSPYIESLSQPAAPFNMQVSLAPSVTSPLNSWVLNTDTGVTFPRVSSKA